MRAAVDRGTCPYAPPAGAPIVEQIRLDLGRRESTTLTSFMPIGLCLDRDFLVAIGSYHHRPSN